MAVAKNKINLPKKNADKKTCTQCNKEQVLTNNYYRSNNKLFDGYSPICKKCLKKMVDYNNIETIYEILKQLDVPFFYDYWVKAQESKGDDFGEYIRMANSLPQFKGYTWKDSLFTPTCSEEGKYIENSSPIINEVPKYSEEWGGTFTDTQINTLNKYYKDLKDDFNIITTNHRDYAKKVSKASLLVDIEYDKLMQGTGSLKAYKDAKEIFDTLCSSAQFAESRRSKTNVSNGITDIVDAVESKVWIYGSEDFEEDALDHLLNQFKNIEKSI